MPREVQDHYFRLAKEKGYLSRAAFKLIEIDDRKRVLRRGDCVLDAGCAPGSWLQVLEERLGPRGTVVGVDLQAVDDRRFGPNVRTVQGDIEEVELEDLFGGPPTRHPAFDAIVSDLGPSTTGDPAGDSARSVRLCHLLLDRSGAWLRRGGNLVMKVYEGGEYPGLLRRAKGLFEQARGFKPRSSRHDSVEMYVVCHGFRGAPASTDDSSAPPRRRPSRGWGGGDAG
ncbi:MAG: RlmE family RNA methyltransferase [Phycisphaerales bacterium]|nr:RlmE family RNA methyltransferase [Phycisphaerales bacterium]